MGFHDALASTSSATTSIMPESHDFEGCHFLLVLLLQNYSLFLYFQKTMPMHLYIWNLTQNSHNYFVYTFIKEMLNILSHHENAHKNTRQKWPRLMKYMTGHFGEDVG